MENYTDIIAKLKKEFDGDNISKIIQKAIHEGERIEKKRQNNARKESEKANKSTLRISPAEIIKEVEKSPLDDTVLQALYKESLVTANLAASLDNKTFPQWVREYFNRTPSSAYTIAFLYFYQKNDNLDTEPKGDDRKDHIAQIIACMIRDRIEGEHISEKPKDNNHSSRYRSTNNAKKSYDNPFMTKEDFYRNKENIKNTQSRNNYSRETRNNNGSNKKPGINFVDDILAPLLNVDPKDIHDARKEMKETRSDVQSELKDIFDDIFKDFNKYNK